MSIYICPVCGFPNLREPAYAASGNALPSFEICPSCGFQFGFTDNSQHFTFEQWRAHWIANGMPWSSVGRKQPENWNPARQLLNINI